MTPFVLELENEPAAVSLAAARRTGSVVRATADMPFRKLRRSVMVASL
jgi:hypothetical protein